MMQRGGMKGEKRKRKEKQEKGRRWKFDNI